MRAISELYQELEAPSAKLKRELNKVGIAITKSHERAIFDNRSDECKVLLKLLFESNLAESSVLMEFRFFPRNDFSQIDLPGKDRTPYRELTRAIIPGIVRETERGFTREGMDGAARLMAPAHVAISRTINVLSNPDKTKCPIAHSFPSGTYVADVDIHFFRWAFVIRMYRA